MKMKIERKIFFYWNVKLKRKINLTKKNQKNKNQIEKKNHKLWFENEIKNK